MSDLYCNWAAQSHISYFLLIKGQSAYLQLYQSLTKFQSPRTPANPIKMVNFKACQWLIFEKIVL
jgi:hypothetical protein